MTKTRFLLLLSMSVLLAACEDVQGPPPKVAEPDVVSLRLAAASEKAADALDNMSKVEQARGPQIPADDFANAPSELQQPITITWIGPIEKILPLLANRAGYQFVAVGAQPPVPITAHIDLYDAPLIKAFADLGVQAGQKANVYVDSQRKVVELRYEANDDNAVPSPLDDPPGDHWGPQPAPGSAHPLTPPPVSLTPQGS